MTAFNEISNLCNLLKSVIEQLEGKTTVMSMLSHPNTDVKHQALLCIQKLMVHHWEYLSKIDTRGADEQSASVVDAKA